MPHIGRKGSALLDENLQASLKRILEGLGEVIQTAKRIRIENRRGTLSSQSDPGKNKSENLFRPQLGRHRVGGDYEL